MKIAIIGWGSLLWDQEPLKTSGEWHSDGPELPLEFCRISKDGRVTLVIEKILGSPCTSYWIESAEKNLKLAIENLAEREKSPVRSIGSVTRDTLPKSFSESKILEWLNLKSDIEAVIWTDLPSNWTEKTGVGFSASSFKKYLSERSNESQMIEYFDKAPTQIQTLGRLWFNEWRSNLA